MGRDSYKRAVGIMADKILTYSTILLLILLGSFIAIPVILVGTAGLLLIGLVSIILDNIWIVGVLALIVLIYMG